MQEFSQAEALKWAVAASNDTARNARYQKYRKYYDGDHELAFATEKFRSSFGALFKTFAYNRCGAAIDAMTDRLAVERFAVGKPPKKPKPDSEGGSEERPTTVTVDSGDTALERQAEDIWQRNSMALREDEVYREAFTCGDAYVLVWPDPETRRPIIWPQPAHTCRVRYADEHPDTIVLAEKCWREKPTGPSRIRLNLYYPDRIERYISQQAVQSGAGYPKKPEAYVPFSGDEAGPVVPNPWGTVPIIHFTNNGSVSSYGTSELRDVIPINDALNKTLADMMIAEEFSAFTQKVIMGVNADPETNDDGIALNPAGAFNQKQLQKLALGADRILALGDPAAKIGEWTASQLDQFEKLSEGWDARVSRVSKVPVHYLTLSSDFPSGRALRTAEAPFVAKLEKKQRALGESWERVMRLALMQDGSAPRRDVPELSVVWNSAAPLAEEDKLDLALQMTTIGIPLEVALKRIGWEQDEIDELSALMEQQKKAEMQREIQMMTAGQMAGDEEGVAA